jgi:hypothetical protein
MGLVDFADIQRFAPDVAREPTLLEELVNKSTTPLNSKKSSTNCLAKSPKSSRKRHNSYEIGFAC